MTFSTDHRATLLTEALVSWIMWPHVTGHVILCDWSCDLMWPLSSHECVLYDLTDTLCGLIIWPFLLHSVSALCFVMKLKEDTKRLIAGGRTSMKAVSIHSLSIFLVCVEVWGSQVSLEWNKEEGFPVGKLHAILWSHDLCIWGHVTLATPT